IAELQSVEAPVLMTDNVRVIGREGLTGLLRQIFTPGPARDAIFPVPDSELAVALRHFERSVMERGYIAFGWYGETDTFIDDHHPRLLECEEDELRLNRLELPDQDRLAVAELVGRDRGGARGRPLHDVREPDAGGGGDVVLPAGREGRSPARRSRAKNAWPS